MQTEKINKFRKFNFRGLDLSNLMNLNSKGLMKILNSRQRRKLSRGLKMNNLRLIKKLRNSKANAKTKKIILTHLRNMIIIPEMIGKSIGIYNGKLFNNIEIKPDMIGHYLGEFSITYKPVKHGKPGVGASSSSKYVPLK
ncbi:40S ribosomal protein S15 (nucleomorph) [Guillardia theta]|uniref:40S ribosomal protein S15 n=1 Tax=Guillardia theta TaxID=55529 RepID=Q98RM9_GUITH|nr:40S ribosomal protein S15 [Guillardia theta]AAK39918.1 40S ribosomal protein S15 [Guillardia theta]|mmetsp:Transcript_2599/g.8686  ORF Transcript_2599/g.8686 Transcript_2599/m.8686 type:complete len:140 (-) Transcript_2599:780-1199(-)